MEMPQPALNQWAWCGLARLLCPTSPSRNSKAFENKMPQNMSEAIGNAPCASLVDKSESEVMR